MGMVEIEIGWEQEAKLPDSADLIIMPGEDYEKLLRDRHVAEISLTHQQWRNSVLLDNIAHLNSKHYDLIARNQVLSLNIKHIERYQPSMHSRALIKEIKESGLRLGGEKTTKRMVHSVIGENETLVKRDKETSEEIMEEDWDSLPTNKHFILADTLNHQEEFPADPELEYPKADLETAKLKESILMPSIEQTDSLEEIRDDLKDEEPFKYLFDQEFEFQESTPDDLSQDRSRESVYSIMSKVSRHLQYKSKTASVTNIPSKTKPPKIRTIDKRLLKSYKKQVERYWRDSKAMEREMTRYIEMNKRCVLLFFNYELSQTRDREKGAQLQEMTQRAKSFLNKRNIKVEKAMKKAELLRAIQQNQYEILQLQSELELLQLRTYPILMYKHV